MSTTTSTTFAFTAPTSSPFQFSPTLDGNTYACQVYWNVFGRRLYLACFDSFGTLVFNIPFVSSDPSYPISLAAGYFTSTLVFYGATQTIVVSP